jgi:hypothetical protein
MSTGLTDWTRRVAKTARPKKATAATLALLTLNLAGQVIGYFRQDLQPVKDKLAAIEQKLEDYERRIKRLEDASEVGTEERPSARRKDSQRR